MNKRFVKWLYMVVVSCLVACQVDTDAPYQLNVPLQVNINTSISRSIVHGEQLPDGSAVGVCLTTVQGADYDGKGYYNIRYVAEGAGVSQSWSSENPIMLSSTAGVAVAYYPYSDKEDLAVSSLPVEITSQTDYMYSGKISGLDVASPEADITMQHAMTDIRFNLVLGDYTGSADVTEIAVASPALASSAMLDATTGCMHHIIGQGNKFTLPVIFSLKPEGVDTDIMFVPDASVESGTTNVSVVVGSQRFSADIDFNTPYKQGKVYTYTLILDNTGLVLGGVTVSPWGEGIVNDAGLAVYAPENGYIVDIQVGNDGFVYTHNMAGFTGDIDWGDGCTESFDNVSSPAHTYSKAGVYTVTAVGSLQSLDSNLTGTPCIKELVHIGSGLGLVSVTDAFKGQVQLHNIHPDAIKGLAIANMSGMFSGCGALESVPHRLFDKCQEVLEFTDIFRDGVLLAEVPVDLFKSCTSVKTFAESFSGCTALRSVPEGLFDDCSAVTNFQGVFNGCKALQSIPEGLFRNNLLVNNFSQSFQGCTALGVLPSYTFCTAQSNVNFNNVFTGGTALHTVKADAFHCARVTSLANVFKGASGLVSIADGAFNCPEVTNFQGALEGFSKLEIVPVGLFTHCADVTNFRYLFQGCASLKTVPAGLFDHCTDDTNFIYTFYGCKALESIPEGLFDKCTKVTNFDFTFGGCTKLSRVPDGLFSKCAEVTSFASTFYGCAGLQAIPEGFFDACTKVTNFYRTFEGCALLQSVPTGLFDKCTKVTDMSMLFSGCSGIKGSSPYTTLTLDDGSTVKVHLYERQSYPHHFAVPVSYGDCFYKCTGFTDYAVIADAYPDWI